MTPVRVVIFAKAPVAGSVKTRLIPALGAEGAARLAHRMLLATVDEASAAGLGIPELCVSPSHHEAEWQVLLPTAPIRYTDQGEGDLGERLARAAKRIIETGELPMLIGTDCPSLNHRRLRDAAAELRRHDAVMYPATDGGYALLGLARFDPSLFEGIAWSTSSVAGETVARIELLGWSLWTGDTLRDVDEPVDLDTALTASLGLVGSRKTRE